MDNDLYNKAAKINERQPIITPPEGTTSDYYHNKSAEQKVQLRDIDKQIKALQVKRRYLQQDFDGNIAARDNSLRAERQKSRRSK